LLNVLDPSHILHELPQTLDEGNVLAKPEQILKTKVCQHQNKIWNEVLIKWKHYHVDKTTWKMKHNVKLTFLIFVVKDNDSFWKGSNVSNQMRMVGDNE
jgi:hypothetical protein